MENKSQRYRYFKDSETDTTWADEGILYVRFDTETNVIYYVGSGGSIVSSEGCDEDLLKVWLRNQIAIEIPEAEAALL